MIIAEMAGGFIGAVLVWVAFKPQFDASSDLGDSLRGVFCTAPGVRNLPYNILQEAIATFWLVFAIKAACGAFDLGTFGVFLTIVSCGTTFGGLTGYAMNAARDTAPRLAFAILPIKGKGDADWAYGLTAPLIGPVIGALVAVAIYAALPL
jgi:glycerol uptake facilitator protein